MPASRAARTSTNAFMERLEQSESLGRAADEMAKPMGALLGDGPVSDALRGRPLGHALHPVLVQVPRAGYAPRLSCQACRAPADCPRCGQPLRGEGGGAALRLVCPSCGPLPGPWRCAACDGTQLRAPQVGVTRTAEELGRAFPQTKVVQSWGGHRVETVDAEPALVLSTPGAEPVPRTGYAAAVLLDAGVLLARPDLRLSGEEQLRSWLQERQSAALPVPAEPTAIARATASNPQTLPQEQAKVAYWLSKKYRVAPEPVAALVSEAYELGMRNKLDATLILAIMAIESSFNPFAQSTVGAQGLMQVMTRVHEDKYQHFGGQWAAFDPLSNLRVGVSVLKECIARAGSLEGGLRYYVGAANLDDDGGYAAKVMAEHERLRLVAAGKNVPLNQPILSTKAAPTPETPNPTANDKVALLSESL